MLGASPSCIVSPPASLEPQRAQSLFFILLSGERPESEKTTFPSGKNILNKSLEACWGKNYANYIIARFRFSFAALSAANEKKSTSALSAS